MCMRREFPDLASSCAVAKSRTWNFPIVTFFVSSQIMALLLMSKYCCVRLCAPTGLPRARFFREEHPHFTLTQISQVAWNDVRLKLHCNLHGTVVYELLRKLDGTEVPPELRQ